MNATARLHHLLTRGRDLAAKHGHDEMAEGFDRSLERVAQVVIVRRRETARVVTPTVTLPARRRRLPQAPVRVHRRSGLNPCPVVDEVRFAGLRGTLRAAVARLAKILTPSRPHAAIPQLATLDRRACAGRPVPGGCAAGAPLPDPGGRHGRQLAGRPRARDGPTRAPPGRWAA